MSKKDKKEIGGIPRPTIKNIVDNVINDDNYYQDYMYTSFSMLKLLLSKSPLHFKYYSEKPITETAAMKFGTAFHTYLLEPEKFKKEYVREPNVDKRTTLGKQTWAKFLERFSDKKWVTESELNSIEEMANILKENKHYKELIKGCLVEHIHLWENVSKEHKCKGKMDAINFQKGHIVDVKTTRNASPEAFGETIINQKYHMQAAYYLDGTGLDKYYIVAIEKVAPYGVCVYKFSKKLIEKGREEYIKGIEIMKEITTKGYSGYNNDEIKLI